MSADCQWPEPCPRRPALDPPSARIHDAGSLASPTTPADCEFPPPPVLSEPSLPAEVPTSAVTSPRRTPSARDSWQADRTAAAGGSVCRRMAGISAGCSFLQCSGTLRTCGGILVNKNRGFRKLKNIRFIGVFCHPASGFPGCRARFQGRMTHVIPRRASAESSRRSPRDRGFVAFFRPPGRGPRGLARTSAGVRPRRFQVVYSEFSRTYSAVRSDVQNRTASPPEHGPPLTSSSRCTSRFVFSAVDKDAASKGTGVPAR